MSNNIHIAQGDLTEAHVPFTLLAGDVPFLASRVDTVADMNAVVPQYTVLGRVPATEGDVANATAGTVTFAGTGNGVLTKADPAVSATVQAGNYKVTLVETTTDSGTFLVRRPDGTIDGNAVVGTAYDGQVKFTIADGATDFSGLAEFTIPVTISGGAAGKLVPCVATATDGSQIPCAVLPYAVGSAAANADTTIAVYFSGHFNVDALVWDASFSTDALKLAAFPDNSNIKVSKPRYST